MWISKGVMKYILTRPQVEVAETYALLNPHGELVSHVLMELTGQLPL